jgi:hypothetical protein
MLHEDPEYIDICISKSIQFEQLPLKIRKRLLENLNILGGVLKLSGDNFDSFIRKVRDTLHFAFEFYLTRIKNCKGNQTRSQLKLLCEYFIMTCIDWFSGADDAKDEVKRYLSCGEM